MTATRTTWWIALAAGLLLACASAQAMDLRDMPQWLRDSIDVVWIDWDRLATAPEPGPAEVHLFIPEDLAAVAVGLRGPAEPVEAVEAAGVQAAPGAAQVQVPRTVIPPGRDAEGVTVRAPDLGAPEGVHLSATGGEMPGPVEVRGLGGVGLAEAESVHVRDTDEEMTRALAEIEGVDHKVLAQAGQIVSIIGEQNMTPEEFVQWARENVIGPKAMAAAYAIARREGPGWNQVTETVSAALLEAAGADLAHLEEIPVCGRPGLAIYLGLLDRGEDVKTVLSSMSPAELATLRGTSYYHVASELLRHNKCLRTAIWAWKTEAARRGPADRALVCLELRLASKRLGDPEVVRDEVIPWAEEALGMPGSESQWGRALAPLLWAYDYVCEPHKAVDRGRYWLQQARERDVSARSLSTAQLRLASALADTEEYAQAADVLREVIHAGPEWAAETAQVGLLKLAQNHPDIGAIEILPAKFTRVWPENVAVRVRLGEQTARSVTVRGNSTFEVLGASCTLPFVSPTVGHKTLARRGSSYEVQLALGPAEKPGSSDDTVVIETNDPQRPTVAVPVVVDVLSPVTVAPPTCFFGFVDMGDVKSVTVSLSSDAPFTVTGQAVDDADLISVEWVKSEGDWSTLTVSLRAPQDAGLISGHIRLRTDLEGARTVSIPYYAHVRPEQ